MSGKLKKRVRSTSRTSNTAKAKVIDVAINRVTVRLGGNGPKLTMIPTSISVKRGDGVIVDYSSGEPLVKAFV